MSILQQIAEITPATTTPEIETFVKALGLHDAHHIPVIPEEIANDGNCFLNVKAAIRLHGGSICYGWLIRECGGLWLAAEFYSVRVTPLGMLVDVTPKEDGEIDRVLFAPDLRYESDFNVLHRPRIVRRQRIYRPTVVQLESELAAMSNARRAYELRRATEKGLPLLEWRALNNPDPLEQAIDSYLAILEELDGILAPALRGRHCGVPDLLPELIDRVTRAQRRVSRVLAAQGLTNR